MKPHTIIFLVLLLSGCAAAQPETANNQLQVTESATIEKNCYQGEDLEQVISACTFMIRSGEWKRKELSAAYNNRGFAIQKLGEHRRAIKDFDKSLSLAPEFAFAYVNRGNSYDALGEHGRAIQDYDQALQVDADNALAYYNRGVTYFNLGEYRRAIDDYSRAIKFQTGLSSANITGAYLGRAGAYYGLGQFREAIKDYEKVLELDPDNRRARLSREIASRALGGPPSN